MMAEDRYREFPCDVCGESDAAEVPHCREFLSDGTIHICRRCGLVYAKRRRAAARIAEVWSTDIFGRAYTAAIPAVRARLTYVAEFLEGAVGAAGKEVCEVGAGEGHGLELLRDGRFGASVFGVEPSASNCSRLRSAGIAHFQGTMEEYVAAPGERRSFDIVTIQWMLENCEDPRAVLDGVWHVLKPGGVVLVATGSRILVPFKKPLHTYFSRLPADTHALRFSANTLRAMLAVTGFKPVHINRFIDHDVLCVIAEKTDRSEPIPWQGDSYLEVYNFFERWYVDTRMYFPDPV
jgi:2-polyprenyl-3-methyl-5-hydroxy-6-metoxy-1,4-benzoquinol methylase